MLGSASSPDDCADDHADDLHVVGAQVDADGFVIGVRALGLQLHGVRTRALQALQRHFFADAGEHDVAVAGLGLVPHGDDVTGREPDPVERVAVYSHEVVRRRLELLAQRLEIVHTGEVVAPLHDGWRPGSNRRQMLRIQDGRALAQKPNPPVHAGDDFDPRLAS